MNDFQISTICVASVLVAGILAWVILNITQMVCNTILEYRRGNEEEVDASMK